MCQNALDLANHKLIVEDSLQLGIHCQWLISAKAENGYVTLEFQNIKVTGIIQLIWKLYYINNINLYENLSFHSDYQMAE